MPPLGSSGLLVDGPGCASAQLVVLNGSVSVDPPSLNVAAPPSAVSPPGPSRFSNGAAAPVEGVVSSPNSLCGSSLLASGPTPLPSLCSPRAAPSGPVPASSAAQAALMPPSGIARASAPRGAVPSVAPAGEPVRPWLWSPKLVEQSSLMDRVLSDPRGRLDSLPTSGIGASSGRQPRICQASRLVPDLPPDQFLEYALTQVRASLLCFGFVDL